MLPLAFIMYCIVLKVPGAMPEQMRQVQGKGQLPGCVEFLILRLSSLCALDSDVSQEAAVFSASSSLFDLLPNKSPLISIRVRGSTIFFEMCKAF